ncbi:hypothetical protein B0T22DRAFT_473270 [Podospora appendiculata]|uniref:Uncharacterized protein n=1 Tax=Podospora appendiculata TaxID=314037 RepID=A0AAE0WZL0_9PEZI|nr:hypothetical protein B0T22DRAFT_473270 [Podospora appendiculata]
MGCGSSRSAGASHATPAHAVAPSGRSDYRRNERVNSLNRANDLQYNIQESNIPHKNVARAVKNAPPPPLRQEPGKFPKPYRNQEGPRTNPTTNFKAWETKGATTLHEYPIKNLDQPPPFASNFNYAAEPAKLKNIKKKPHPNDKRNYEARWREPPNDPGAARAVTDQNGTIHGVMYHPKGNPAGYTRSNMMPLDREGRRERVRADDRAVLGRPTWPERGSTNRLDR